MSVVWVYTNKTVTPFGTKESGDVVDEKSHGEESMRNMKRMRQIVESKADKPRRVTKEKKPASAFTSKAKQAESEKSAKEQSENGQSSETVETATSDSGTGERNLVEECKTALMEQKLRRNVLAEQLGVTDAKLADVLTEANGFERNAQGWYEVIQST